MRCADRFGLRELRVRKFSSFQIYTGQLGWQQMLIGNLERAGKLLAENRRIATAEGYAEGLVLNALF